MVGLDSGENGSELGKSRNHFPSLCVLGWRTPKQYLKDPDSHCNYPMIRCSGWSPLCWGHQAPVVLRLVSRAIPKQRFHVALETELIALSILGLFL